MFEDREQAGLLLARLLSKYQGKDAIIFGLPRGGVAVAGEISRALGLPLNIVVARKIGQPRNPEYAIAAVSESGCRAENLEETEKIEERWVERAFEIEEEEAKLRRLRYMKEGLPETLEKKIAILVDDGVATGLTMKAALKELKTLHPEKLVVAVPIVPEDCAQEFEKLCDEFVAVNRDKNFLGAVGSYYRKFPQLTDEAVIKILSKAKK